MKQVIPVRGEREVWIDFVATVKKQKKQVWDVLGPMLKDYVRTSGR
jgi:hypothetical protein